MSWIWHIAGHIFFHPDFTVGFGVSPNQLALVDFTTSRDFHSALKIYGLSGFCKRPFITSSLFSYLFKYTTSGHTCKD